MRPLWWAALLAPLAAPLAAFLFVYVAVVFQGGWSAAMRDWMIGVAFVTAFILPASCLALWVLGLPYIYWLRATSRLTAWNVCLGAVGVGAAGASVWGWISRADGNAPLHRTIFGFLIIAGLGLCVALAFCWIARVPFRADRTAADG